jgi:hypothetical protein
MKVKCWDFVVCLPDRHQGKKITVVICIFEVSLVDIIWYFFLMQNLSFWSLLSNTSTITWCSVCLQVIFPLVGGHCIVSVLAHVEVMAYFSPR